MKILNWFLFVLSLIIVGAATGLLSSHLIIQIFEDSINTLSSALR